MTNPPGLLIAAPASGSGKTAVTLGLLGHLRRQGRAVASIKVGPDYIDPGFHSAASQRPCHNLDPWAMREATLQAVVAETGRDAEMILGEGVMGLFDGAADGQGSTADLALLLSWPVVLVVDARAMGASVAALVEGFARHREGLALGGVILNRVGSARHEAILRRALAPLEIPVLGVLGQDPRLALPSRHLGLVQAGEHPGLESFLSGAADAVGAALDGQRLCALARPSQLAGPSPGDALPPLGQRIALARDQAFAFSYASHLSAWRAAGAEIRCFSPLADEAPDAAADAVFLPGGYPELHGGRLAGNHAFLAGLTAAARRGAVIYGECGGFMVLGQGLEDAEGQRHAMAGLLPLESSFARRERHLGYRRLVTLVASPLGPKGSALRGHEFHYATSRVVGPGEAWLDSSDACGAPAGDRGLRDGAVFGGFVHVIDREA